LILPNLVNILLLIIKKAMKNLSRRVVISLLTIGVCIACSFFCFKINAYALGKDDGLNLVNNGVSSYTIVIPQKATSDEKAAATILQKYIGQITGFTLPIKADNSSASGQMISIGNTSLLKRSGIKVSGIKENGFLIKTTSNNLFIVGTAGKGNVYGVYTFLDKYLGCRKIGPIPAIVPKSKDIALNDAINDLQNPGFNYREIYFYNTLIPEQEYRDWHKLNTQYDSSSGWGLFVHTFNTLVPPEKYFKTHPEYYALRNGKRTPTQLCLSNPEVLQVLEDNLATLIQKKPGARYWSVSQNDNYNYCTCDKCNELNFREKSQAATILTFVNKVAARFPDKIISTLAYQYSQRPPLTIKPAANVNIMLTTIGCDRNKPIKTDNGAGAVAFRKDFEGWTSLTNNIIVWDYVSQYAHFLAPFPNIDVIRPNLQYFHDNKITAIFEQGAGGFAEDFAELKNYLIAELMWNPNANEEAITADFLKNMYGDAAGKVKQYLDTREQAVVRTGAILKTGGGPKDGANTFLAPDLLNSYSSILKEAADQVKSNPLYAKRVSFLQLTIDYAAVETAKATAGGRSNLARSSSVRALKSSVSDNTAQPLQTMINSFTAKAKASGVKVLNENFLTLDAYGKQK
jgi:hypothetical protein